MSVMIGARRAASARADFGGSGLEKEIV